jgi:hypothetical protein
MAVKRWIGGAPATKRVMTLTLANTWSSADTARVSVGIQDLTIVTDSATKSVIATQIANAINAASASEDLISAEVRNVGGQQIPEFREFTALASGDTVILTANTAGVYFNVTAGETTAGDGTLTAAETVAGSGPNHANNLDNYEGGALPVDGDTLMFDVGGVDCLYGLDYFRANSIELHIIITGDYTGQIGLPAYNSQGGYDEYRTRGLQLYGSGADHDVTIRAGGSFLTSAGSVYLDSTSQSLRNLDILAARGSVASGPTVFVTGGSWTNINALRGAVSIEPEDFNVAGGSGVIVTGAINVGVTEGQATDVSVWIGSLARLCESGSLNIRNGQVVTYANTKVSSDVITSTIYGGTLALESPGAQDTFIVYGGGVLRHNAGGGTTVAVTLNGGSLDMSGGTAAQTITTLTIGPGSTINGGGGRLTAGATWI